MADVDSMNTGVKANGRKVDILSAAERVFDSNGYAATTMEAVAELAGISKGSIYNYFQNKHDLFTQVFAGAMKVDHSEIEQVRDMNITATEKLQKILDGWFARLEDHRRVAGLVLEFWATAARQQQKGDFSAALGSMYSKIRSAIVAIIEQGMRNGEFNAKTNPVIAASLITALADGLVVQSIFSLDVNVNEEFIAAFKRAIFNALKAPRD